LIWQQGGGGAPALLRNRSKGRLPKEGTGRSDALGGAVFLEHRVEQGWYGCNHLGEGSFQGLRESYSAANAGFREKEGAAFL